MSLSVTFGEDDTGINIPDEELRALSQDEQSKLWAALWLISNLKCGFMPPEMFNAYLSEE